MMIGDSFEKYIISSPVQPHTYAYVEAMKAYKAGQKEAEKKIETLTTALKFYADKANWFGNEETDFLYHEGEKYMENETISGDDERFDDSKEWFGGKRARKALAAIGEI